MILHPVNTMRDSSKQSSIPDIVSVTMRSSSEASETNDSGSMTISSQSSHKANETDKRASRGGGGGGENNKPTGIPSTLSIPNYNQEMGRIESHFYRVGCMCIVTYASLLLALNVVVNSGRFEVLSPTPFERSCSLVAFVALALMITLQYVPLFINRQRTEYSSMSGVVFLGLVVVCTATFTNFLMAFAPNSPVIVDPVTGARVHMFRWCEWTCLAFCMTFLVEGCDVPDHHTRSILKWAYIHAASQGLSAFCGFVLPLCRTTPEWLIVMSISCATWAIIFPRLHAKRNRLNRIDKGTRLDEQEVYHRVLIAFQLMTTIVVGWTIIVVVYFIFCCFGPMYAPPGSLLANAAAPIVAESFMDVCLKSFYNFYIISMHEKVFDEGTRAKRRLEELRQTMWSNSSDVLALSVRSMSGVVTTTVSPTFFRLLQRGRNAQSDRQSTFIDVAKTSAQAHENGVAGDGGMCFELTPATLKKLFFIAQGGKSTCSSEYEVSKPLEIRPNLHDFSFQSRGVSSSLGKSKDGAIPVPDDLIGSEEMQALAILIARSWQCLNRDTILPHDLVLSNGFDGGLETIQCEAKVTRLEEASLFLVVRDISERFHRFEAEKLALSEMTARKRDSEANRFTRHEVKNGLLASLGLCDAMSDLAKQSQISEVIARLSTIVEPENQDDLRQISTVFNSIKRTSTELDSTLQEVLDTVLAEAMARDVIHGVYQPQNEPVDICNLLRSNVLQAERFSITTPVDSFPQFFADPHLLKCIHRNAISNACKYGAKKARIETTLSYDPATNVFTMEVINQAGDHHSELRDLEGTRVDKVFEKGKRLHPMLGDEASGMARRSSGDGAWIMQNCAKTLRGACAIKFQEKQTVFSMWCPLDIHEPSFGQNAGIADFKFPKNTWAIGLDDSKIQRKLMGRLFGMVGIKPTKCIIRGETAEEMMNFDNWAAEFVASHPEDFFLFVVDENLDVVMEDVQLKHSTFSGSQLVQSLRHKILPEQERQMLCLIRSANDSKHDIAVYRSRAHGFLAKAPLKKEFIKETMANLWTERFSSKRRDDELATEATLQARNEASSSSSVFSITDSLDDTDAEVLENINTIEILIANAKSNGQDLELFWPEIWEKLHAFKGDLVCLNDSHLVIAIASKISNMRGPCLPAAFSDNFKSLRTLVRQLENESMDDLSLSCT